MTRVQTKASLHEKTVKKVAKDSISAPKRTRGKAKRPASSRVKVQHWSDGVDERIVEYIQSQKVAPSRLQVVSSTEVIIWNNGVWE